LVVGEDQIRAAPMDVHRLAQEPSGHGRALDVPTGTPVAPWTLPPWLVLQGGLPQHEVQWVVLVRILRMPASLGGQTQHLLAGVSGQLAVTGVGGDVEVDG